MFSIQLGMLLRQPGEDVKAFRTFLLLTFLLLAFVLSSSPVALSGEETIVTQNPTDNYTIFTGWFMPEFAYTSNNKRAYTTAETTHFWWKYHFDTEIPDEAIIEKVEIGVEHYETSAPMQHLHVSVTWDNGTTWSPYNEVSGYSGDPFEPDVMDWCDSSGLTEWTKEKLCDDNLQVQVKYHSTGGGSCFAPETLVTLANGSEVQMRFLHVGDLILAYNGKPQAVTKMTEHLNHWPPMPFYNISLESGRELVISQQHLVATSLDRDMTLVENLTEADSILNVFGTLTEIESINLVFLYDYYNLECARKLFYAEQLLVHNAEKQPWTGYLDWLPVRVTYTLGEEEGFDFGWYAALFFGCVMFMVCITMIGVYGRKEKWPLT